MRCSLCVASVMGFVTPEARILEKFEASTAPGQGWSMSRESPGNSPGGGDLNGDRLGRQWRQVARKSRQTASAAHRRDHRLNNGKERVFPRFSGLAPWKEQPETGVEKKVRCRAGGSSFPPLPSCGHDA